MIRLLINERTLVDKVNTLYSSTQTEFIWHGQEVCLNYIFKKELKDLYIELVGKILIHFLFIKTGLSI